MDLNIEDEQFHSTTFTNNPERRLEADLARLLLKEVVREKRRCWLLSADHLTVDGMLLEVWTSHKSHQPREEQSPQESGRDQLGSFTGERGRPETHESIVDHEARMFRRAPEQEARICCLGHVLSENRHGLISMSS